MIVLDHVNVVVPIGATDAVVGFYALLGLVRVPKTGSRSEGAWFALTGGQQLHVSERDGVPHPEQHVAFAVDDLDGVVTRLVAAGHPWRPGPDLAGRRRGMTADPAGNGVELLSPAGYA